MLLLHCSHVYQLILQVSFDVGVYFLLVQIEATLGLHATGWGWAVSSIYVFDYTLLILFLFDWAIDVYEVVLDTRFRFSAT